MKSLFRIALIMSVLALFVASVAASPIAQERTDGQSLLEDGRAEDAQAGPAEVNEETGSSGDVLNPDGTDSDEMGRAQVFTEDLIVKGSNCVGLDCATSESFSFDTLRLKENNLRIHFDDTSSSAAFPNNDWRITINDSDNNGENRFSIDDATANRTPFTIEAGAPSHALYVDSTGQIGVGQKDPVVEMHVTDGDSPTLRLNQDGSNGWTPQTWDIAGNETNFFVRDVTNGSKLPFKIKPGAPDNSLFIAASGNIGLGATNPGSNLVIKDAPPIMTFENSSTNVNWFIKNGGVDSNLTFSTTHGTAHLTIDNNASTTANRTMLALENNGPPNIQFHNTNTGIDWYFQMNTDDDFVISHGTVSDFKIREDGTFIVGPNNQENLKINGGNGAATFGGTLTVTGGCISGCKNSGGNKDMSSVLEALASVSFIGWDTTYTQETDKTEYTYTKHHLGPNVAQFDAAFGIGDDSSGQIAPLDVASVALAAAQELHAELQARDIIIAEQQERISQLEERVEELDELQERLDELEELVNDLLKSS